jgi:hypothetical protein
MSNTGRSITQHTILRLKRLCNFGNVGTLFSFRIVNTDAEALQKEFGNIFISQQFVDLEGFSIFTKILENGANKEPFKGVILQPMVNTIEMAISHITRSREKYATRRNHVETRLGMSNFRH